MAVSTRSAPLVDTDWLAVHLGEPQVAIVEVDEDTEAFQKGHIPGAVAIDWSRELRDGLRRDFISGPELAALLGSKGLSDRQSIVLYGGNNNWFAAYAYWLFRLRGVGDVRLLDGGRRKWEVEGRPTTTITPAVTPTTFTLGPARPGLRITRDEVLGIVLEGGAALVDVRSPEEFRGERLAPAHLPQEQPYVGGHIPGARNVPWARAAQEDGSFRPAAELRELYAASGIDGDQPVVTYCRIGERSAHTWFVLTELLGYRDVRNYDGSWTEYGSLVGVPVER